MKISANKYFGDLERTGQFAKSYELTDKFVDMQIAKFPMVKGMMRSDWSSILLNDYLVELDSNGEVVGFVPK